MENVQAIERTGEGPGFLLWAVREVGVGVIPVHGCQSPFQELWEELGEVYQWFSSCKWPLCVSLGSRPSGELVK